ncbi:MAG: TIR domain-containing protein [Coleofasciculus chthonoplastes F3-SA18-01]|uniref:toll/interleukin-1 receptor domain-containing protein n=1 Tax=Coleofasciculus chthonoplastes TaxID=64178 RepID=UPI0032F429CD
MNKFCNAFISYGRADSKAFATKLYDRLLKEGLKVWFDQNDIPLGVDFQNQIDDGIEKGYNFLFIIAPHSVNSPYCGKEIELALKRNKRIIPLLHVEQITQETWQQRNPKGTPQDWEAYQQKGLHSSFPNMHPAIGKINWVYFREGIDNFEQSFADLIDLLKRHADYVEKHTHFLARALEWERHQKQTSYLLVGEERQQAEAWLKIRFKDEQPPCVPSDLHCEYITESIKNANNLMTQVFISYADEDRATMEKIRKSLRRKSITVWTNTTDIQTGEAFEEAIKRGIEQADNVVYLLSPDSVMSDFARRELESALSLNKRIIPVLVREIPPEKVPSAVRDLHYIDLTDNVKEEDYQLDESQLLKILHQDEAYYNEHKILLTKALKWKRQHENPSILLRGYNLRIAETWLKVAQKRTQHPPTTLQEEFIAESLRQPPLESLDVFISYSRADSDFARMLNDALQMQGKTTWFDQESIASGSDFQQEIYRGIRVCDNILFVLSPRSVNSPYCADEVEYAASLNKRFVTVLHQQVNTADLHPELAKMQWIDFNQNQRDFNANFNQLVRTLDTDREHVHSHSKWLQRALEWQQKDKSADLLLRGSEFAVAENWLQEAERDKKKPISTALQQEYIRHSREAIEAGIKREKRQVAILRSLLGLATAGFVFAAVGLVVSARLRVSALNREIEAMQQSAEARLALGQPFDALFMALKASQKLNNLPWYGGKTDPNLTANVVSRLQQSIFSLQEISRLEDKQGKIADVSLSADGQTIATIGDDKTLKIWHLDGKSSGDKLLENSENLEPDGMFSPDGQILATETKDKTVKLWQRDGTFIAELKDEQGLFLLDFSANSQIIATLSRDNKSVKLWRRDGSLIKTIPLEEDELFRQISPDGQIIATTMDDKNVESSTVKLRNQNGTVMSTITEDNLQIYTVSFSPDGQIIATNSDDTVKLWRRDGTLINTLKGHERGVGLVKFRPDSQIVVTTSYDGTVRLWERNGARRITIDAHEGWITDVTFSPDGQTIATASADKTVKLWDIDGTLITTLTGHNDWVTKVLFSPDGERLISRSDDGTVKLWQPDNPLMRAFPSNDKNKNKVNVIPLINSDDGTWGKLFATTVKNGSVRLWKTDDMSIPIKTLIPKSDGDVYVNLFNKGQTIVTAINKKKEYYGPVQLWKTDGTPIKNLIDKTSSQGSVWVDVSPERETLVTSINEENSFGPVQLWKADGTLIKTLIDKTPVKGDVNGSFSDDGQTLVTWINEENSFGPVQLWKADGTLIRTLIDKTPSTGSVNVNFFNKGQTLVTWINEENSLGPVQLWKVDSGIRIKTLIEKTSIKGSVLVKTQEDSPAIVTAIQHQDSVNSVQLWQADGTSPTPLIDKSQEWYTWIYLEFSSDGQTIVISVNDGPVTWWKTDGTPINTLKENSDGYSIWDFSPDNQTVALQNKKQIILWNRDGSTSKIETGHKGDISTVLFRPKGEKIVTSSYDDTTKLWNLNGELITTFTGDVRDLMFSADGKSLMTQGDKYTIVRRLEGMTHLETLQKEGCKRMKVYLEISPNVEKSDRTLCAVIEWYSSRQDH